MWIGNRKGTPDALDIRNISVHNIWILMSCTQNPPLHDVQRIGNGASKLTNPRSLPTTRRGTGTGRSADAVHIDGLCSETKKQAGQRYIVVDSISASALKTWGKNAVRSQPGFINTKET
ncbi:hypothetical protein CISG_09256 [Coccidioides immitis RMSCC 3703]|uniref:Uncharacterized protein n=1 Tax=Coccidioides immitis RMSCC 3703 TaxID=454286 RepID=A0A0J8RCM5_COCIT|nr:hypothetical protein CISG_09256 [Coccidioides immitis RMSCC 3703]